MVLLIICLLALFFLWCCCKISSISENTPMEKEQKKEKPYNIKQDLKYDDTFVKKGSGKKKKRGK